MVMWLCWSLMAVCVGAASPQPGDRGYVAEWQWEQWPNRNLSRNPGARLGSSLWFDSSAGSWWLFGGRLASSKNTTKVKIYTDLWRYDSNTRAWSRIFPNDKLKTLVGGMITLRTSLFNEGHVRKSTGRNAAGVVLCGRSEGKSMEERSLAVYGPRSARSDTVWQLELKDKQWTAYVCCCDNTERPAVNTSAMPAGTVRHETSLNRNYSVVHGSVKMRDDNCSSDNARTTEEPVVTTDGVANMTLDMNTTVVELEVPGNDSSTEQPHKIQEREVSNDTNQAFCPDFQTSISRGKGQPVAWCDTSKEFLVALDLRVLPLTLWQFDLRTSHWTQQKVDIEEGTLWPGCSSGIRHASTGSTVYILCLPYGYTRPTSTRLVYRIDASTATLQASGQLQLNNQFDSSDGNAMWADETRTILQTVDTDNNKTLLLIAYDKLLDIWLLDRNNERANFVQVDNIWRGSALKWFRGFDAPFYILQMAGQSWLLPNPRQVSQYWPRERGRFIIRLIEHGENSSGPVKGELHTTLVRNHSAAEASVPIMQHHPGQDGIKALVFFALSLSIFAIFGLTVFVRRCVTCPPQSWPIRGDDGCKATPPVIRYSVIPDDLAYPVA